MDTASLTPPSEMNQDDIVDVAKGFVQLMDMSEEHTENAQKLAEGVLSGVAIGDLCGLTSNDLELIYSMGRTYYQNAKYEDAETVFRFLTVMEYSVSKYWMALAATLQMKKEYHEAACVYGYAAFFDLDDPRPHLQAGFCLMQLGMNEPAIDALEASILATNATDATKLQARALLAKLGVKNSDS